MTFSSYDNLASNSQLLSYNEALILSGQATTCSGNMLHSWCIMFGYDPDSPHSISTSPQLDIYRNQRSKTTRNVTPSLNLCDLSPLVVRYQTNVSKQICHRAQVIIDLGPITITCHYTGQPRRCS